MSTAHSPEAGPVIRPAIGPGAALAVGAVLGAGWVAARSIVIPLIWLRIRLDRATRINAVQRVAS